jgi:hypothetical protein
MACETSYLRCENALHGNGERSTTDDREDFLPQRYRGAEEEPLIFRLKNRALRETARIPGDSREGNDGGGDEACLSRQATATNSSGQPKREDTFFRPSRTSFDFMTWHNRQLANKVS